MGPGCLGPLLVGCSTTNCCYYQPLRLKRSPAVSAQARKCWRAENMCGPWTTGVWMETLPWAPHSFIPLTNMRSGDKYQIKEVYFSSSLLKDSCNLACSEILLSFVAAVEIILPIWTGSCFRRARGRILLLLFLITGSSFALTDWTDLKILEFWLSLYQTFHCQFLLFLIQFSGQQSHPFGSFQTHKRSDYRH